MTYPPNDTQEEAKSTSIDITSHVAEVRARKVVAAEDVRNEEAVHKILGGFCRTGIIVMTASKK